MTSADRPDRDSSDMPLELPPLPDHDTWASDIDGTSHPVWSAESMQAYARAAVLADRECRNYPMAGDTERLLEIGELRHENEKLRDQLVQMDKAHREDLREAAAEARHRERFPDELMITDDSTDTDMPKLSMIAYILLLLLIAFGLGAWTERSDSKAEQALAGEPCKAGEVAYLSRDGAQTLCLQGSNRMGNRR